MAAPKRNKNERERDLATIAQHYLRGIPQWKIGETLGVSQQVVCRDLKVLRQRWLDSSLQDFNDLKSRELAKIDDLETVYWTSWERSTEQKRRKEADHMEGGEKSDDAAILTGDSPGDPRFLQGVERCIERRCKLLGLDEPDKHEFGGPNGGPIPTSLQVNYVNAGSSISDNA